MSPHFHICSLNNGITIAWTATVADAAAVTASAAASAIYYKILLVATKKRDFNKQKKIIHCALCDATQHTKKKQANTNPKSKIWKVKGSGGKEKKSE